MIDYSPDAADNAAEQDFQYEIDNKLRRPGEAGVSRSALAGVHFGEYFQTIHFAAGEKGYSVDDVGYQYQVPERNAAMINDPRFTGQKRRQHVNYSHETTL